MPRTVRRGTIPATAQHSGVHGIVLAGAFAVAVAACEQGVTLAGFGGDVRDDDGGDVEGSREADPDGPDDAGDSGPETEGAEDAPAEADAPGEDAAPEGFVVFVGLYAWGRELVDMEPAAGAVVVLDLPGGERVERVAGADGRVVFDGIDRAGGPLAVTAWSPGRALTSRLGIAADVHELTLPLFEHGEPSGMVDLSGTALHMDDEAGHCLLAWASVPSTHAWDDVGPDWSIRMLGSVPFLLVVGERTCSGPTPGAHEFEQTFFHWLVVEHAALSGPSVIDVDFHHAGTTRAVHGSFSVPARIDSELRTSGYGRVSVWLVDGPEQAVVGDTTHTFLDEEEDRFEYDVEWLDAGPSRGRLVTGYYVATEPDETPESWIFIDGAPTEGEHDLRFMDVRMIAPPDGRTHHPLHAPIEFESFDAAGGSPVLAIYRDEDLVWWVEGPADAASMIVPEPPAAADVSEIVHARLLEAWLSLQRNPLPWNPRRSLEGHTAARLILVP
jgi:hypothetical protein